MFARLKESIGIKYTRWVAIAWPSGSQGRKFEFGQVHKGLGPFWELSRDIWLADTTSSFLSLQRTMHSLMRHFIAEAPGWPFVPGLGNEPSWDKRKAKTSLLSSPASTVIALLHYCVFNCKQQLNMICVQVCITMGNGLPSSGMPTIDCIYGHLLWPLTSPLIDILKLGQLYLVCLKLQATSLSV